MLSHLSPIMHKEYKVQLPNGHCPRADADADADANIALLVSSLIQSEIKWGQ